MDTPAVPPAPPAPPAATAPTVGLLWGDQGRIIAADDAFLAMVGYTRDDLDAGRLDWEAMTPPEWLHLDRAGMAQAARSGAHTVPYEKEFVRKDGTRVRALLSCAFDTAAGDARWACFAVDVAACAAPRAAVTLPPGVTPGRETAAAALPTIVAELVRERTRMLAMLDGTTSVIWTLDPDMRMLAANQAFQAAQQRVIGRPIEVGETLLAPEYPTEWLELWRAFYTRVLGGERFTALSVGGYPEAPSHFEHVFSPVYDPVGRLLGATVVSQDVTLRVRAETALRESEARFRTLTTESPIGVFLADPEGRCVYANARLCEIFGLTLEQTLGRGFYQAIHPEDRPAVEAQWDGGLPPTERTVFEYRLLRPDGTERSVRIHAAPVRDGGRITGYVGSIDDVTEERAQAVREGQRAKMESLGTLAGGIAHDFNNLLAVILGNADLAAAEDSSPALLRETLGEVRTAALRARDLVRQILAFSRRTDRQRAPVDLAALVRETLRLLRASLPATVRLDVRLGSGPVIVEGDASGLQQVVLNLCANAEHAMRGAANAVLTVTLTVERDGSRRQAVLTVRDTGSGFATGVRDRLFEPFFTTKPPGEGTGLGLAVVHGIVSAHGGTITADNAPDGGAVFRVALPADSRDDDAPMPEGADAGPSAATVPPAAPAAAGRGQVLVVEDESAVARMTARVLEAVGYTVRTCGDGLTGLGALAADPGAVRVLVTDLTMPELPGDELIVRARALRPDLPVVLMSGYSGALDPERGPGGAVLLAKPFTPAALVDAVEEALARAPDVESAG